MRLVIFMSPSAAGTRQNDILLNTGLKFFVHNGSRPHSHFLFSSHYGFPTIALAIAPSLGDIILYPASLDAAHLLPSRAATFLFIHHGAGSSRGKQLHFRAISP